MGTFAARTRELEERVGTGELTGSVTVDQVYAQYQHERLDLKHPAGGRAKYLSVPLIADHPRYFHRLARNVFTGMLRQAMIDNVEDLSLSVYQNAPLEFGDLRASGSPRVSDQGTQVYHRPPNVHRLSRDELRAKQQLRRLGFGNR